jgi:squalene synthase HpnC
MSAAQNLASGKGHKDENFPVASLLISARHRPAVFAFYAFARAADDVADHPTATPDEKLALLEKMRASLTGESDADAVSARLRAVLRERDLTPQHGLDLLEAFRRDVTKRRYADWNELMDYCRYSAAPVGRMVLDLHGEPRATWPANDALCAALQVINHLQDCGEDRRDLDRVYLPEADLAAAGADVAALDAPRASPPLKSVIGSLARRTQDLLVQSRPFAGQIADFRLRAEVAFIQRLAEDLAARLAVRDPLSERVHHRKSELVVLAGSTVLRLISEPRRPPSPPGRTAELTS